MARHQGLRGWGERRKAQGAGEHGPVVHHPAARHHDDGAELLQQCFALCGRKNTVSPGTSAWRPEPTMTRWLGETMRPLGASPAGETASARHWPPYRNTPWRWLRSHHRAALPIHSTPVAAGRRCLEHRRGDEAGGPHRHPDAADRIRPVDEGRAHADPLAAPGRRTWEGGDPAAFQVSAAACSRAAGKAARAWAL